MPTFIVFGALTQVPLSDLDNNFAVLAAIASIPCTAVGTNTLVLTPQAGMPAVPAYSNLMPFSAIAANTNTAAATAQIGALAALNIYRDTASGPQPLTGGEITTNNQFTLVYDPALNSSAGGFHLISAGAYVQATGGTIVGSLAVTGGISGRPSPSTAAIRLRVPSPRWRRSYTPRSHRWRCRARQCCWPAPRSTMSSCSGRNLPLPASFFRGMSRRPAPSSFGQSTPQGRASCPAPSSCASPIWDSRPDAARGDSQHSK